MPQYATSGSGISMMTMTTTMAMTHLVALLHDLEVGQQRGGEDDGAVARLVHLQSMGHGARQGRESAGPRE